VWHIYPQDENLHHKKLRAFLQRYAGGLDTLAAFSLHWNGAAGETAADWHGLWQALRADMPVMADRAAAWERDVLAHGDLASNLLKFADSLKQVTPETRV
jgi:hypothetical protein